MSADKEPLTVVIADDHQLFRDGLRALIASMPDAELVGEAGTGEEAIALAESSQPDVLVMDLRMPGIDGIEATRRIVGRSPNIAVLVVTMLDDDGSVFAAMKAGARGYLLKGSERDEVMRAIQAVGRGEAIFSPAVARRLMDYFARLRPEPATVFPELSEREREILELVADGLKNAQIAAKLSLSPKTIRNHVSNILSKLQVADRTQATVLALAAGLGPRPQSGGTHS
jgi:DNA-binding NarL/FixJ family response regulator